MSLTASEVAALKSSLDCWTCVEYVSTGVVLLGVIGEYVAEFTKFAEQKRLTRPLGKLSTLVLIVGLAGELIGLIRTYELSGQVIASLTEQAARANQRTAEIEERLADRTLNLAEAARVSLGKFPRQRFEILTYADDREARKFSDLITGSLESSGWRSIGTAAGGTGGSVQLVIGVKIEISNGAGSGTEAAARALASIFTTEHILDSPVKRVKFPQDPNGRPADIIRITVGRKP